MKFEETEESAKTKWCPQSRINHRWGAYNRTEYGTPSIMARCIASQCMMWKWTDVLGSPSTGKCGLVK